MSEKLEKVWLETRDKLNAQQRVAAETIEHPLRVKAGPGTGKTHMMVARLVYLIVKGVKPENILMMTFTTKAAKEMMERAEKTLGMNLTGLTACTFHSFCSKFMREFAYLLDGYSRDFLIIETSECVNILDYVKTTHYPDRKDFPPMSDFLKAQSASVNKNIPLQKALEMGKKTKKFIPEGIILLKAFETYKKSQNIMDFNDLLVNTLHLLKTSKKASDYVNNRYLYKMVDEFQDTNYLQMSIVIELCKKTDNICIVGDLLQQLYKFNGADNKIMYNFAEYFRNTKDIFLSENYRSSAEIVDVFNNVSKLAETGEQILHAQFSSMVKPQIVRPQNSKVQNLFILDSIKADIASGVSPSEIAVLFRTAMECAEVEQLLTRNKIPFEKYGGPKFFEQKFVIDLFAWLKILNNPWHVVAWFRILKLYEGISDVNARKVCDKISMHGVGGILHEDFQKYIYFSGLAEVYNVFCELSKMTDFQSQLIYLEDYYFKHWELVIERSRMSADEREKAIVELETAKRNLPLFNECTQPYSSALEFLNDYTLSPNANDSKEEKVVLSTIHSSKGLEWDKVYIMNASENIFPQSKELEAFQDELCCFYVAASRPRKQLVVISPENVLRFGRTIYDCDVTPYMSYNKDLNLEFI